MNGRSRNWSWTLNNYTEEEFKHIKDTSEADEGLSYGIAGKEIGEQRTPHLQGYFRFTNPRSLRGVKERYGTRLHLEKSRGTPHQNRTYCAKDGDIWEKGVLGGGQGSRTDLVDIKEAIDEGLDEKSLAQDYFSKWCVYRRSFEAYRKLIAPKERRTNLQVECIYGPSGSGKTRYVHDYADVAGEQLWISDGSKWFDGYSGQRYVLFDDFDGSGELGFRYLLRLLDIYPVQVQVKGGYVDWVPMKIFITSNKHYRLWYPDEDYTPLERRLTSVHLLE